MTLFFSCVAIVCTLFDGTGSYYHRIACLWSFLGLKLAGVTLVVSGLENVPLTEPVIFMSNHQSNFDILSLYQAIPKQFSWIAKEELFSVPLFGQSMRRAGYIALDRSDGRRSLKSMISAAERINGGASVIIFPEGTRSDDGRLIPFKRGGFLLAEKAKVPVVPVAISGSGRVNPAKKLWLKPGEIRIRFAEAISVSSQVGKRRDDLLEQVKAAISANLEA
jgi:1-acyl-sn-glycerol-3-phosphate acyltransferase